VKCNINWLFFSLGGGVLIGCWLANSASVSAVAALHQKETSYDELHLLFEAEVKKLLEVRLAYAKEHHKQLGPHASDDAVPNRQSVPATQASRLIRG
jgi:hypothetical protein